MDKVLPLPAVPEQPSFLKDIQAEVLSHPEHPYVAFAIEGGPVEDSVGWLVFAAVRVDSSIDGTSYVHQLSDAKAHKTHHQLSDFEALAEGGFITFLEQPIAVRENEFALYVTPLLREGLQGNLDTDLREVPFQDSSTSILIVTRETLFPLMALWASRLVARCAALCYNIQEGQALDDDEDAPEKQAVVEKLQRLADLLKKQAQAA